MEAWKKELEFWREVDVSLSFNRMFSSRKEKKGEDGFEKATYLKEK